MKLSVFLEALLGKENVTLVIMDNETDTRIAEMIASSYTSLDDTIESRVVKRWQINAQNRITVVLGEVAADSSAPSSDPSGDPSSDPSGNP